MSTELFVVHLNRMRSASPATQWLLEKQPLGSKPEDLYCEIPSIVDTVFTSNSAPLVIRRPPPWE